MSTEEDDFFSLDFTQTATEENTPPPEVPLPTLPPLEVMPVVPAQRPAPVDLAPPILALAPDLPPAPAPAPAPDRDSPPAPPAARAKRMSTAGHYYGGPVPAALRFAAISNAAGRYKDALRQIQEALNDNEVDEAFQPRCWIAMLQLLQVMEQREAFIKLALSYFRKYGEAPPPWAGLPGFVGQIDVTVLAAAGDTMRWADFPGDIVLDLSQAEGIGKAAVDWLADTSARLAGQGRQLLFLGAAQFAQHVMATIQPFEKDNARAWQMLFEVLGQSGQEDMFTEAANDYASIYNTPAPVFPRQRSATRWPLKLIGELVDPDKMLAQRLLAAPRGQTPLEIDASGLVRIEAKTLAGLKPVLQTLADAGVKVIFNHLPQLVAVQMGLHDLHKLVVLETR